MFDAKPAVEIDLPPHPHYFGPTQLQDYDKFLSGPQINVNNISKLITYIKHSLHYMNETVRFVK